MPPKRRQHLIVSRLRQEGESRAGVDDGPAVAELVDGPDGRVNRQSDAVDGDAFDSNIVECGGEGVNLERGVADSGGVGDGGATAGADHEVAGGRRRQRVVHKAIRKLVPKSTAELGGEGNGASAQSHDATCSIECGAGDARPGDPKAAAEGEVREAGLGAGEGLQGSGILGEEAGGEGAVGVGVVVGAGGVEARVVAEARVGDEAAGRIEAVVGGEGGGVAGEEGGGRRVVGAVSAGGALDPDQVAAGIGNEEEALGRGAEAEIDKVLAGAGGGARNERGFDRIAIAVAVAGGEENGETVGVEGEGVRRGGEWIAVKQRELQELRGGGGIGKQEKQEERKQLGERETESGRDQHCGPIQMEEISEE